MTLLSITLSCRCVKHPITENGICQSWTNILGKRRSPIICTWCWRESSLGIIRSSFSCCSCSWYILCPRVKYLPSIVTDFCQPRIYHWLITCPYLLGNACCRLDPEEERKVNVHPLYYIVSVKINENRKTKLMFAKFPILLTIR